MQTFLYVEINAFALVILFLIFLNIYHRSETRLFEQKLFLALIISDALILLADTGMWILEGKTGFLLRETFLLVTAMYYILNPLICMMWSLYADFLIYRDQDRLRKIIIPFSVPAFINLVLSVTSLYNGMLFYIDENNVYHRGKLFLVMAIITYLYLSFTLVCIILKQHKIKKRNFIPILVFVFPPFIGGVFQTLFYGLSLIWVCTTISILIVFINIQNDQLYTDYLTGLYNRRNLDCYLRQQVQNRRKDRILAGLMIDVDSFKRINDIYGHNMGDNALETTADILKKTFQKMLLSPGTAAMSSL